MISPTPPRPQRSNNFWTTRRVAATFIVLALLATLGISSCATNPTTNGSSTNANRPSTNTAPVKTAPVGGTTNPGAPANSSVAPPTNAAPPNSSLLTPLPVALLDAPLKTIDGKPFKLSESKGKVLVLDLWATWCGPCRQEIPHLVELNNEMGERGVEVIGLDIDPSSDTPEDVRAFMTEFNVNYKVAFLARQYAMSLMSDNGSIPQSYVITRDGKIYKRFIGFSPVTTPPQIRAAIEDALNMKS